MEQKQNPDPGPPQGIEIAPGSVSPKTRTWPESAADRAGTMASGRYMAYSPSPSTAPHSPHIPGIRSALGALAEQEK
ncbi:hypothetical protein BHM03_00036710 [Ensete ventricosum]|nr:hypothetical protein BHM03_00036710 [Ensete ventricosum]